MLTENSPDNVSAHINRSQYIASTAQCNNGTVLVVAVPYIKVDDVLPQVNNVVPGCQQQ